MITAFIFGVLRSVVLQTNQLINLAFSLLRHRYLLSYARCKSPSLLSGTVGFCKFTWEVVIIHHINAVYRNKANNTALNCILLKNSHDLLTHWSYNRDGISGLSSPAKSSRTPYLAPRIWGHFGIECVQCKNDLAAFIDSWSIPFRNRHILEYSWISTEENSIGRGRADSWSKCPMEGG